MLLFPPAPMPESALSDSCGGRNEESHPLEMSRGDTPCSPALIILHRFQSIEVIWACRRWYMLGVFTFLYRRIPEKKQRAQGTDTASIPWQHPRVFLLAAHDMSRCPGLPTTVPSVALLRPCKAARQSQHGRTQ